MKITDHIKVQCIELAQHAIGLNHKRPYTRHGKRFYKPYRNYFSTLLPCESWEMMVLDGYAAMHKCERNGLPAATFWLTRKGLDWLGSQLGMYIYNESN